MSKYRSRKRVILGEHNTGRLKRALALNGAGIVFKRVGVVYGYLPKILFYLLFLLG